MLTIFQNSLNCKSQKEDKRDIEDDVTKAPMDFEFVPNFLADSKFLYSEHIYYITSHNFKTWQYITKTDITVTYEGGRV